MLSQPPCSFVTCPSHRTPRPVGPVMKSEDSSRPLPCNRPRAPLEAMRACLGAACGALPTGERGLGSSRACPMEQGGLCP
jgi:hypothetical protein